ncbi:hypothetical protein [Streptomyces sp. NPDC001139]
MSQPITDVVDDAHATPAELIARAQADHQHHNAVAQTHAAQGGTGERQGILPGGDR